MKAVMVYGPKSGEIISMESPMSDYICFAIPRRFPMPWEAQPEPTDTAYLPPVANYRRVGRVTGSSGVIDVYEFVGMTT